MNKKDILELKRRFKKETCTFSRLCGCYVDGERNRVLTLGETFLNIEDEAFYKYLEIAKKVLSGTLGNNLLELEFPLDEEMETYLLDTSGDFYGKTLQLSLFHFLRPEKKFGSLEALKAAILENAAETRRLLPTMR